MPGTQWDLPPELVTSARRVRRFLLRRRRILAAALTAAAALAVLEVLEPPSPLTAHVVVMRHDLAAGARLTSDDVRELAVPPEAVPANALTEPASVTGRVMAAAIESGEPVTETRLVGPSWVHGLGPGRVAAPVRLSDAAAAAVLRVGDHIDVYAATASGPTALTVVQDATVAAVPASDATGAGTQGGLVVVAVTADQAAALAQQAARTLLTFTLVG